MVACLAVAVLGACVEGLPSAPTGTDPNLVVENVEVTPASFSLQPGETQELVATATDTSGAEIQDPAVSWSSSDTTVAVVNSEGVVTGRRVGDAEVSAVVQQVEDDTDVTVTDPTGADPAVQSVEVTPAEISLDPGETRDLAVAVTDTAGQEMQDPAVAWRSSDTTVATVSADGVVTGQTAGDASVSATFEGHADASAVTVLDAGGSDPGGDPGGDEPGGDPNNRLAAFPEAYGYGQHALADCRSLPLRVHAVTNTQGSGAGSFRAALNAASPSAYDVVVFRTGGTITLRTSLAIEDTCLYVAGQTAPGGGIQLRNHDLGNKVETYGGSDMVFRYLRSRPGLGNSSGSNGFDIRGGERIVLDHVSVQWGGDENIAISGNRSDVRDITVQWSITAEGLVSAAGKGLLWADADETSYTENRLTVYRNYFASNTQRNPRIHHDSDRSRDGSTYTDVRNNVMYNWGDSPALAHTCGETDIVKNHFRQGPNTPSGRAAIFINCGLLWLDGNVGPHWSPGDDQWSLVAFGGGGSRAEHERHSPVYGGQIPTLSAEAARDSVLASSGASARLACDGSWVPARDRVDERIVDYFGVGGQMVADPSDVGGYPSLSTGTPCPDGDGDGLPDAWEDATGATDPAADPDGDGYLNIEEYLNGTLPR